MKRNATLALAAALAAILAGMSLAGCASTKVTGEQTDVIGLLPRPGEIWIYNFTANPTNIPDESVLTKAGKPAALPTAQQLTLGAQLGDAIASNLVQEIRSFGMPAALAATDTQPQINDIIIRGYFVSIEQGSRAKRLTIGFGSGGSELTTLVEGYQMTPTGLRKLGSGTVESGSGKKPGEATSVAVWAVTGSPVGLVVGGGVRVYGEASGKATLEGRAVATAREIAGRLKIKMHEQGWVN